MLTVSPILMLERTILTTHTFGLPFFSLQSQYVRMLNRRLFYRRMGLSRLAVPYWLRIFLVNIVSEKANFDKLEILFENSLMIGYLNSWISKYWSILYYNLIIGLTLVKCIYEVYKYLIHVKCSQIVKTLSFCSI